MRNPSARARHAMMISRAVHAFAIWLGLSLAAIAAQPAPPAAWPVPQDGILSHDPAVVWGRLPNGLRYAIRPGGTPQDRVSLRLLVEAGSLMETERQRGLAHFLEHMAFEGSQNLAPGELVAFLQRAGLAFGPDTNASTTFDQTVYQLDLPRDDPQLLDRSLGILSEIAGRLSLPPAEIETERGVILSEKRARDTPGQRSGDAMIDFLLPGSRYAERTPIGLESVIRTAPRDELLAFYHDWYRPERQIVIVTGDVQPAGVEELIQRHFGNLAPSGPAPEPPPADKPMAHSLDAAMFTDPGLPASVALNVVLSFDDRPDSLAKQSDRLRELLAGMMLQRRLDSLGLKPDAPFSAAGTGVMDLPPAARLGIVNLTTTPEQWQAALAAGEQELRRALTYGFSQAELDQALAILRNRLETIAARASTRRASDLADQLVDAIGDEVVYTSPATDLQLLTELSRGLSPADVDAALRKLVRGHEPQIFVSGPMRPAPSVEGILAAYRASQVVPVTAAAERAASAFGYTEFGPPTAVTDRTEIADLGITRVRFANGVVLYVKRTPFEAGTVRVAVRFGSGRIGMPADKPGLDLLAGQAFVDGGLGRHDIDEIERILASRQVGVNMVVGESGISLISRTTPADLPLQLDLFAAYMLDPAYRPEALARFRARLGAAYAAMKAEPDGLVSGPIERLIHGGDVRFAVPPEADAEQRDLDELRSWLGPMLQRGPLQVSIVGDIDPEEAIADVARTFGALPDRGSVTEPTPPTLTLPHVTQPVRFTYQGKPDRALAMVYWPTSGHSDGRTAIGLDLVADILADRLLQEVREHEGATYSPEAYSQQSLALPGYGYVAAAIDVAPGNAERIAEVIETTATQMRGGGITADEFDRALQPRLAQARSALQSNGYWLHSVMLGAERFPQLLDDARTVLADTQAQSLEAVQALAAKYLDPERAVPVLVLPQG
ncbi:MAG: M16 family metallopeptidase [Geminicoccaceae bacterium]